MCTAVSPGSGFKTRQGLARIVFAAQHFFPLIGGTEHTAAILLHALAKRGYAVEAICQGTGHVIHHKGIPVHRVSGPDSMRRAIVSAKPDILLTQLHLAPFVIRTGRRLHIPVMLIIPSHEPVCPAPMSLIDCDRTCSSSSYWMEQEESMRAQEGY